MNADFDHHALAKSIGKMLATANATVEKAGASIVTQRLIDYSSGEFGKLTHEQLIAVLTAINPKYEANLLKDGSGRIIGYVHSGKIFVSLKDNQQKAPPWQQTEAAADVGTTSRGRGRSQQRRGNRHTPSNPEHITGESMSQKAGKKSDQGGGQEDYAAKYAAQYMGKQEETKTKSKSSKKKKDEAGGQGGQEDYAAKYAAQYMGQQGGEDEKSKKKKKADKKKSDKKSKKKSDKKKSNKKKK